MLSYLGHPLGWTPHGNTGIRNSTGSQNWRVLRFGYILIWTKRSYLQMHDSFLGPWRNNLLYIKHRTRWFKPDSKACATQSNTMTCQSSTVSVANHNTTTQEEMLLSANSMPLFKVQAIKPCNQVGKGTSITQAQRTLDH